jgi:hypothetical protein
MPHPQLADTDMTIDDLCREFGLDRYAILGHIDDADAGDSLGDPLVCFPVPTVVGRDRLYWRFSRSAVLCWLGAWGAHGTMFLQDHDGTVTVEQDVAVITQGSSPTRLPLDWRPRVRGESAHGRVVFDRLVEDLSPKTRRLYDW